MVSTTGQWTLAGGVQMITVQLRIVVDISYRAITGSSDDHRGSDARSITGHCRWRQSDRWRQEDRCELHALDRQAQDRETVSGLVLMIERPERQKKIFRYFILNAQLFPV
jgi:hypothetical protein